MIFLLCLCFRPIELIYPFSNIKEIYLFIKKLHYTTYEIHLFLTKIKNKISGGTVLPFQHGFWVTSISLKAYSWLASEVIPGQTWKDLWVSKIEFGLNDNINARTLHTILSLAHFPFFILIFNLIF